jgi:hypothetical protein
MDVWATLSRGEASPRDWLLLETHPNETLAVHGNAIIVGDWKIYKRGGVFPDVENGWFAPPGQDPSNTPYTLKCGAPQPPQPAKTACENWCLWNITADPCEYFDVADKHPDVVLTLSTYLRQFAATAIPQEVGSGCNTTRVPVGESYSFVPCDWRPPQ